MRRRRSESESEQGARVPVVLARRVPVQSRAEDPKPSDLAMARLKVG